MQIGIVGLGRMGGNIMRRLARAGHAAIGFDASAETRAALAKEGMEIVDSLAALGARLAPPRALWLMLPHGEITEAAVTEAAALLQPGDAVIDGGNSFYKDDVRRAAALKSRQIAYLDVGVSGGVWGLERGYCLMIGGDEA
ncbi:MAG: NAD(P)-binding domain-containing protein, partial [Hyphomonadaceae bacterium]